MKILLMAPEPFYQDRGTPIAVNNLLKVISERGDQVDVVTYHEGRNVSHEHVTIHRTRHISFIRSIPPGFSWKKVICDFLMIFKALSLASQNRYDLVHAVEESVFIALLLKVLFRLPYVYDMDSSLADQLVEQKPWLWPFSSMFTAFEGLAVRQARAVIPVCDALAEGVERFYPEKLLVLHDVSLLKEVNVEAKSTVREQLRIEGVLLMYVGNLQVYQGIDLLLDSFALALKETDQADLVIIGGAENDIEQYLIKAYRLGILDRVHFLGPRPLDQLAAYLAQADILVSPRIKGRNTPMKVYSYLHSGKPVLATAIPSHTQVVDDVTAVLTEPEPALFAEGMLRLINNEELRLQIGAAGRRLIESEFSYPVFHKKSNELLDWLKKHTVDRSNSSEAAYSSKF